MCPAEHRGNLVIIDYEVRLLQTRTSFFWMWTTVASQATASSTHVALPVVHSTCDGHVTFMI